MIRWVVSPGLGLICIYDGPRRPGLAPWVPAFHTDEIRLLSSSKRKFVTLADWRAVCAAKRVFPEAYVTDVIDVRAQRKRWERAQTRRKPLYAGPQHEPETDD